jgi:hypothetical protein
MDDPDTVDLQPPQPKETIGEIRCPECNITTPGIVSMDVPWYIYLVGILGLLLIGKLFIILIPFLVLTMKNQIRRCPECHGILEAKNMFSVESLDDEVFTFKLSDMIIILKKKYLYVFVVVLFGVLCAMYYYSNSAVDPR